MSRQPIIQGSSARRPPIVDVGEKPDKPQLALESGRLAPGQLPEGQCCGRCKDWHKLRRNHPRGGTFENPGECRVDAPRTVFPPGYPAENYPIVEAKDPGCGKYTLKESANGR